jgi:hypothetical protein
MRVLTLDDMEIRQQAFRRWFLIDTHDEAFTAPDAIKLLENFDYDVVMLDHDLAEEHYLTVSEGLSEGPLDGVPEYKPGTGMDVVDYIINMPEERRPKKVIVHSWNPSRSQEMYNRLRDAGFNTWKIPFTPNLPYPLQ